MGRILLLLLLFFLCLVVTATSVFHHPIIASRMEGKYLPEEKLVASVVVGTPGKSLRLALDFTDRFIRISRLFLSITYQPSRDDRGTDVVHIGGKRLRLNILWDSEAAAKCGCPTCDGTLGVGSSSSLWIIWRSVTMTAGSMLLDTIAHPIRDSPVGVSRCIEPHQSMCATYAKVYGKRYMVDFTFSSAHTLVPVDVYDKYVGIKSVGRNPPETWSTLEMEFGSEARQASTIRLSSNTLVVKGRHGVRHLLLGVSPRNDTIYMGRCSLRSMMVYRDFVDGIIKVVPWETRKHYSIVALILGDVLFAILVHWKLTQDGMIPPRSKLYPDRAVLEIVGTGLAVMIYYIPEIRDAVRISPSFDIYVFFAGFFLLTWEALSLVLYAWNGTAIVGDLYARKPHTMPPIPETPQNRLLQREMRRRRRRRRSEPSAPRQRGPPASPFTNTGMTWPEIRSSLYRRIVRPPPITQAHIVIRSRASLIRQVTHENVLLLAILLLSVEARIDSFALTVSFIFAIFLTLNLIYHIWMAVYCLFGYDRIGVWLLFTATLLVISVATIVVTYTEITQPYLRRRLSTMQPKTIDVFAATVYVAAVLLSSAIAGVRIQEERKFYAGMDMVRVIPVL